VDVKRKYVNTDESWYATLPSYVPYRDIIFGVYAEEGGTTGEMTMVWNDRGHAKLEAYDDSFSVLAQFKDVIDAVADHCKLTNDLLTKEDFIKILEACGFEDDTTRTKTQLKNIYTLNIHNIY
jgi:hypothetical protein